MGGYPHPVTRTGKLKRCVQGRSGAATSAIITLSLLINDGEDELMTDVTSEIPLESCDESCDESAERRPTVVSRKMLAC